MSSRRRHPSTTLRFGEFFGTPQKRRELPGWSFARIAATKPPAEVPDHTHDTAHLVLVLEGSYVSGATRLEPGRPPILIYNPPGTTHADRFRDNRGSFFTISVSDQHLESMRPESLPIRPFAFSSGPALRLSRRLLRVCESWPRHSRSRAERVCLDLLEALCHAASRPPRPPKWLLSAREALVEHFDEPLPIRELASAARVHPVHLIRSFRRFFGLTPGQFLRRRRLRVAARLLTETDLPIAEIALRAGFADQSHFTRAFGRAHAIPPAAYRRRQSFQRRISG